MFTTPLVTASMRHRTPRESTLASKTKRHIGQDFARSSFEDFLLAVEEHEHLRAALVYALETLTEDDREILDMCGIDGRSVAVLAEELGISCKAAAHRYDRARKALRTALGEALR